MTNVTVQGLLSARRKELRQSTERAHHLSNELQDHKGRCYTYRGVTYCYE